MNDTIIELMNDGDSVTVFILERGKGEYYKVFKKKKDAIDFIIKYLVG